jgi:hypothetical protein
MDLLLFSVMVTYCFVVLQDCVVVRSFMSACNLYTRLNTKIAVATYCDLRLAVKQCRGEGRRLS